MLENLFEDAKEMCKPEITNDMIIATDVSVSQFGQELVKKRLDELILSKT